MEALVNEHPDVVHMQCNLLPDTHRNIIVTQGAKLLSRELVDLQLLVHTVLHFFAGTPTSQPGWILRNMSRVL